MSANDSVMKVKGKSLEIETKYDVVNYLCENFGNNPLCILIANKLKNNEEISKQERGLLEKFFEERSKKFHELVWEHERYGKMSRVNFTAANDLRKIDEKNSYRKKLISSK